MLSSFAYETAGAARTRHSLCPLFSEGHVVAATAADFRREAAGGRFPLFETLIAKQWAGCERELLPIRPIVKLPVRNA